VSKTIQIFEVKTESKALKLIKTTINEVVSFNMSNGCLVVETEVANGIQKFQVFRLSEIDEFLVITTE
jgi:hypothetical protein